MFLSAVVSYFLCDVDLEEQLKCGLCTVFDDDMKGSDKMPVCVCW